MGSILHLTLAVADRSVEAVIEEVRPALEAAGDESPELYEHHSNVAVTRGYQPADLQPTAVPRVVETVFSDTTDAGDGTLYQQFDDRFVAVDSIESPAASSLDQRLMPWEWGHYVVDYFRINYGIAPRYGYDKKEVGTTERPTADADWDAVFAVDSVDLPLVDGAQLRDFVRELADGDTVSADCEEVAALLDCDLRYPLAGALLRAADELERGGTDAAVVDALQASEEATRAPAVQDTAAVGTSDIDRRPVDRAQLQGWVRELADDDTVSADRADVVPLLACDPLYPLAGALLRAIDERERGGLPETTVSELGATDEATRARAVREVAAVGTSDTDEYTAFLDSVATVDSRTRALVAPSLWQPAPLESDGHPDPALVTSLLDLTADSVAELRVGAFMGATKALGQLQRAVVEGALSAETAFDGVVAPLYDAYERLLTDPDVRLRERAVALLTESTQGYEAGELLHPVSWHRLPFERRWEIAQTCVETAAEPESTTHDAGAILASAFDGEPAAVPTLVDYAYDEDSRHTERVRSALAAFAADNPTDATPAVGPAVDALLSGAETTADVELLAETTRVAPDAVAPASDALEGLLDADGEQSARRRAAARALSHLPGDERTVDTETLTEAVSDVYTDSRLVPERVAALADVNSSAAAGLLADLPELVETDERVSSRTVDNALLAVGQVDSNVPEPVRSVLVERLSEPTAVSKEAVAAAALLAAECPDAMAPHAETLGRLVAHPERVVREAAGTAVVALGARATRPLSALSDRADDAIEPTELPVEFTAAKRHGNAVPDWPFGALAAADRQFAVESVRTMTADGNGRDRRRIDLVLEAAAGDSAAGGAVLAAVLEQRRISPNKLWRSEIPDEHPELLLRAVPLLAEWLTELDADAPGVDGDIDHHPELDARAIEALLTTAAGVDDRVVAHALDRRYPSTEAFYDRYPSEQRDTLLNRVGLTAIRRRAEE